VALRDLLKEEIPEISDGRWDSRTYRIEHQDDLDAMVERWTRRRSAEQGAEALQESGVAASPVMDVLDLINDSNYEALRTGVRVDVPVMSPSQIYQGIPWKLSRTPGAIRLPTPRTGQHNGYVFGEILGLDDRELARLRVENVIGAL
jgi:formyl-CoA transferase